MRHLALLLFAVALIAFPAEAKKGYNLWAKERIRYFKNKVLLEPYNPQLRLLLANAYHGDGQGYEALVQLRKAIALDDKFAEAHCNLAVALHAQSRLAEAKVHYDKALELEPNMIEAMAGLGTLLCRGAAKVRGMELLEEVLERNPDRSKARFNLAVAYHKGEDYAKAIAHLETLSKLDANYPGAKAALARAYYSQGLVFLQVQQYGSALTVFELAYENQKADEDLFFAKGLAHLRLEEFAPAEAAFLRAVELERDHVPALHNLANICERTDRLGEATRYYERVRDLVPHLATIEAARHAKYDVQHLIK